MLPFLYSLKLALLFGYFFPFGCQLPSDSVSQNKRFSVLIWTTLKRKKIKDDLYTLLFAYGSDIPIFWLTAIFTFSTANVLQSCVIQPETTFQSTGAYALLFLSHRNSNKPVFYSSFSARSTVFLLCSQDSCWSLLSWPGGQESTLPRKSTADH